MTQGKNEKKPVVLNGLRQNCFVLDSRRDVRSVTVPTITAYSSLEKKELPNGFTFNIEKQDYPITSDSVTSYVESSDYRRDPMQAIAKAPKRVNLGDISQVQDFVMQNPQDAVKVYKAVGEKLQEYYKNKANGEKGATPATPATPAMPAKDGE